MKFTFILHILGALLVCLALALLIPLPFAFTEGSTTVRAFLLSASICLVLGVICLKGFKSKKELSIREGFAIVTFGWVVFAVFGALPYLFSAAIASPLDAIFETMSGFTTTG